MMTRTNKKYLSDKVYNNIMFEHPSHKFQLLEGLNSLRNKGELLDISLVIEDNSFGAHKAVLAACSDYFRAMFTDNMLEARQEEICINGITAEGFRQLLDYAYTTRLTLNIANVQEVLEAACHVQMLPVVTACSSFLQTQIDIDNCVDIATIAETYSLTQLKMKVFRFMSGHLLEFSNSPEFYRLTPQQLENLLACDYPVDCSEADVLRIVLAWFFHVDTNDLDVRLAYAARIIRYIHLIEIPRLKIDSILKRVSEVRKCEWQLYKIIFQEIYRQSTETHSCSISTLLNSRGMKLALLKIGGFGMNGITNEITFRFSSERKWKHLTSIPHIEQCNFGTAVYNNDLFILGGCFDQSLQENIHPFGFKYSPRKNKWSTLAPMKIERCRFSLNVVGDMIYAVGGASEEVDEYDFSTCECYNPLLDSWYMIQDLPAYVTLHAGAGYENNYECKLFISGGIDRDNEQSNQMYCYDVNLEKWKTCSTMFTSRADHVMLRIGKFLYVCGGWTEDSNSRMLVDTIEQYDVEKDTWRIVTTVPTPRYHAGIVAVEHKIYFVGGFSSDEMFDKDTAAIEIYDVDTGKWTVEDKYPQDIWEHTCATLYIPKCRDDMEVLVGTEAKT